MFNNTITVEVNKLPSARRSANIIAGDTVERALVTAFGAEDYSKYSIIVNGTSADLRTTLAQGDVIAISKQTKGN